MPIPGSGAISMSMFNTELGRASNTANSSLAGGTTPAVGSLFWLANQSGSLNQTAPHAMSEWYGYAAGYNVSIYFRAGQIINNGDTFDIYTSQDNTNWTLFALENSSTSCTFYGTVIISSGTIYVKAQRSSDNTQVYIRGANSSTCPANAAINCTYSTAITGTEDVAITVYVEDDGFGNFGLVPC